MKVQLEIFSWLQKKISITCMVEFIRFYPYLFFTSLVEDIIVRRHGKWILEAIKLATELVLNGHENLGTLQSHKFYN